MEYLEIVTRDKIFNNIIDLVMEVSEIIGRGVWGTLRFQGVSQDLSFFYISIISGVIITEGRYLRFFPAEFSNDIPRGAWMFFSFGDEVIEARVFNGLELRFNFSLERV